MTEGGKSAGARLYEHLAFLYGPERAPSLAAQLAEDLAGFRRRNPGLAATQDAERVNQRDAVLITYGDMVQRAGTSPLDGLATFLDEYLTGLVSAVHLLPFYPYSSDDGFSVIDYQAVNPELGTWKDVARVGSRFRLMFDAVINHISAQSAWFQRFLADDPAFRDYFITVKPDVDLSLVFRPRALPLLTEVETTAGRRRVWTTFSADQVDLNYANPQLLLEVIRTLLFYVEKGAELIRLDAIGFMWKEIGTSCLHLPQTHRIIQLMRTILDQVAPRVLLITETNVPHEENISYFGDGFNEAQMVYNFSLPPLTLHAFHTGQAGTLSRWAERLTLPSPRATYFNFLASHDGIGLMPARGILSESAVSAIARRVESLGGHVSYKNNPDGSQSPYELNINYLDALAEPNAGREDVELVARRFLASQAIMLAIRGVPGIYFHSLFGSRSWHEGVTRSGRFRTINRQKLRYGPLVKELANPASLRHQVFHGYRTMLKARAAYPAFHPAGRQRVVFCDEALFALLRTSPDGDSTILCLQNVSSRPHRVTIGRADLPSQDVDVFTNVLDGWQHAVNREGRLQLVVPAYGVLWLTPGRTGR